jgi:hypothetical protein
MRTILLAFLGSGIVLAVYRSQTAIAVADEPVFEGKSLSEWIKTLKDPDREVRWQAAEAFRKMGPRAEAAVPTLIDGLRDRK